MTINVSRRPLLAGLALAMLGADGAFAREEARMEEAALFGMIGKLKAQPGKRAELIGLLGAGTDAMPGCLAYLIAEDATDPDGIWITEIWKTKQYHADSLKLPAVQEAIAKGRPLIAGFEVSTETRPVGGFGMPG